MHYNAWRLVSLWLPAHISSCWAQITYILHYYRYHSTGLQHSFPTDNAMPTPPHPKRGGFRLCVPPSKYKRERVLLEPWGTRFQSCRITAKGCLAEALSPRGVSLLPRDLIKTLTIHLPGMPVMSKLHFKS